MNPLVAVTSTTAPSSDASAGPHVFLYASYIEALDRAGLAGVPLSAAHGPASMQAILERCGGLVLSGGGDIDPCRYGQEPGPTLEWVSEARDAMELRALEMALGLGMPVLAICRGVQLLNVFRGGTLWQDLPAERPGDVVHAHPEEAPGAAHDVEVGGDTLLAGVVGAVSIRVNSFHHQGIRELGHGLRVVATAPDGLVEAVDDPSAPWLLGVQWHPERRPPAGTSGDAERRIFAAFRDAVLAYAGAGAAG